MAVFALSITKDGEWRGTRQPFSNVYHYLTQIGEPFNDQAAINEVVAAERKIHATSVNFKTARTWGPVSNAPPSPGTLTPGASVTREIVDLSGTGELAPGDIYRELAFLIQWPLGRYGSKNRPQFLRKWIHPYSLAGTTASERTGSVVLSATAKQFVVDQYAGTLQNVGPVEGYGLCTATGREPISGPVVYDYFEHHQLGDQWR
jgi:hypothetical protein